MGYMYDTAVIGGGPGGYVAAQELASSGHKTALIEFSKVGGTCLHRGCIPTKTLMHSSEIIRRINSGVPGVKMRVGSDGAVYDDYKADVDMKELQIRRGEVSSQLADGVTKMLKKAGVHMIEGLGTIISEHEIEIRDPQNRDGAPLETITAENIIIATGSKPGRLPVPGADLEGVMTSDQFIINERRPVSLVIVGGGVIGVEFATIYIGLGTKVTILEGAPRLLGPLDREFSQSIKMILKKRGADIHTGAMVKSFERLEDGVIRCTYTEKGEEKTADAGIVLVAAGRIPQTEGLFGNGFSLEMNGKYIKTDENRRTSCPNIYAIGDVIGGVELAHMASAEARNVVRSINGEGEMENLSIVPGCVYTDPEIAYTGMTMDEAKAAGIKAESHKYPMMGNSKSVLSQQERGFIKVVADKETRKILGAQLMCARATDMVSEFAEAIANGLTVEEMADVIHPHPTFSEGITEVLRLFEK